VYTPISDTVEGCSLATIAGDKMAVIPFIGKV